MPVTAPASPVAGTATPPAAAAAGSASASEAGEQRFLKLLVTQLNNQDPLNPMQNAELTSQLAQMSTVSGIEKMNGALQSLIDRSGAAQLLQSASLVERTVLTPGSELVAGGEPAAFAVELPASAQSVKAVITDAAGRAVRTIEMGSLPEGLHSQGWDGRDDAGRAVTPGVYRLDVHASNATAPAQAGSLVYSKVASVGHGAGGVSLQLLSGKTAALADVRSIL